MAGSSGCPVRPPSPGFMMVRLWEIIPFYGPTIQVNVKIYKIYPVLWWMNGGYIMMFNDFLGYGW